uniref:(northern house mosquito) hypothetical protein n=1 Tax=Culex pipiens TaxID=7175 RepID=A0A8D8D837_CULPI
MLRCAAPAPTLLLQAYSRGLFWDSRSQRQAVLLHSPTNVDNTAAAAVVVFVALSVYFKVEEKRGTREDIIAGEKRKNYRGRISQDARVRKGAPKCKQRIFARV